jgi:hypothetical protein
MTMSNATRRLAMLVVLLFAMRHSMYGQTTTTDTNCTVYGNTANCTSTSTDDSAAIRAQQQRQAEQDQANEQAGAAIGNAMGRGILAMRERHKFNSYCKQHAGEPYTRTWPDGRKEEGVCPGTLVGIQNYCKQHTGEPYIWSWPDGRKQEGTCPGTLVVTKEKLVEAQNAGFITAKVAGYAESSGDKFTIHSERASDMRFHMILANKQQMEYFRMAGIKTLVYTNDSDQRFTYDLMTDHVVTAVNAIKSSAPTPRETYCKQYPRGRFTEDDGSLEYCDVRDDPENQVSATAPAATPSTAEAEPLVNSGSSGTATKTVASTIPQSATAVAPAASPATASGTADTPKPCFTDKSGHTVCLAQH